MTTRGRMVRVDSLASPLAPPPADDTAALITRLRAEIAMHQRSVALWREIALAEHGELAKRLVQAEHKCSMLRFLLFSAWLKLGEAMKKIAALELER